MHSVLFVARLEKPLPVTAAEFLALAEGDLAGKAGVERLADNVWLLNLRTSVEPLGLLLHRAQGRVVARILPFEHPPEWLPESSGPVEPKVG